ncbi:MAG: aspartate-semialdehyde dehydrogenase [Caedibacter sp. 38-128]|nr:aspartate-semialdehyde dehydrogenase [Holosporales bacterium]OJX05372.1 MAG: aspartate-semialdehyde dehydrogenase [Caedibacter sp. 38-128]
MTYRIAIMGATGNVGREALNILAERRFPIKKVIALASQRSKGTEVSFGEDKVLPVKSLEEFDFTDVDFVISAVDSKIAAQYLPKAAAAGAIIVDKSSHFRLEPDVPLLVPEVNSHRLQEKPKRGIIASPNCVVIPLTVALKPLHDLAGIKRIVLSTYQSVSGAGSAAMDELFNQTRAILVNESIPEDVFPKQIAFNLIPQIDRFHQDGFTAEEEKIALETRKIFEAPLKITATCVRVPVFIGHCLSVNVEFEKPLTVEEARAALQKSKGIFVLDRQEEGGYITPLEIAGEDVVCVSRLRQDTTVASGLSLWIAADNLRKGAALNAVQILEALIKKG